MSKTTIKTIRQFKDGIDAAFETQQARDRFKARYDAAKDEFDTAADDLCAFAARASGPRESRPLALLAVLGRPLARATLGRSRKARAVLECLDERGSFAARSRSASSASGLEQLELPRIAALHSALPPTPANPALGLARIPTLKLKLKAKAVSAALLAVALAATFSGCYVGKATFQGEDMRMYPFFSTTAATAAPTD